VVVVSFCVNVQVTYGSLIKLQHERTKYRLHSHEVPYGSGSGQQSVTAFPGVEDGNSYWVSVSTFYACEWYRCALFCLQTASVSCFGFRPSDWKMFMIYNMLQFWY
jgi:hypothetical protein